MTPTFAVAFYFVISCSMTLYHKWLFDFSDQGTGFHFPILVVLCQMLVSFTLTLITLWAFPILNCPVSRETSVRSLIPISVFVVLDILLTNEAINTLDVPVVMMLKSTSPLFVLGFSFACGMGRVSGVKTVGVLLICIGASVAVSGEGGGEWSGAILVIAASMCAGLRSVLSQLILQAEATKSVNALTMVLHVAPTAAVILIIPFLLTEREPLTTWFARTPSKDLAQTLLLVLLSCLMAFLLNITEYVIIQVTSALTLVVAGIAKTALIVLLSAALFGEALTLANLIGFGVCLCGILLYNLKGLRGKSQEHGHHHASNDDESTSMALVAGGHEGWEDRW